MEWGESPAALMAACWHFWEEWAKHVAGAMGPERDATRLERGDAEAVTRHGAAALKARRERPRGSEVGRLVRASKTIECTPQSVLVWRNQQRGVQARARAPLAGLERQH